MGAFAALVLKDLGEVLSSRYFLASLVGGFAVLIAMGYAMGAVVKTAQATTQKLAVVVNGTTPLGERYAEILRAMGGEIYHSFSPDLLDRYGYVVVIPGNFSLPARLPVYIRYRGLMALAPPNVLQNAAAKLAEEVGVPPRLMEPRLYVYMGRRVLTDRDVGAVFGLFLMSWIFMFIVPLIIASTAAVSIGMEKEKRTFELILSTPVTPTALITAKFLSTLLLAIVQFGVMTAGLFIYMANIAAAAAASPPPSGEAFELGFAPSPQLVAAVALSSLALALALLGLAFLAATKTDDVKTAQSVVPLVVFPLLIPSLAALFGSVEGWEAYPFVHPLVVAYAVLQGEWERAYVYLALDWALAAAVALVVARAVTAEYLVLGRARR
ncbi:ABC transporter permease [Pyrobaculum ferrireducens]|uniref:ABC transporter permease n=1 Tax=Pyrobaculum ferrireducens TaxID=1104324 RepID=UPI0011E55897|nr:ABC transporter permease [Pyrobaculum ferrireducens]